MHIFEQPITDTEGQLKQHLNKIINHHKQWLKKNEE